MTPYVWVHPDDDDRRWQIDISCKLGVRLGGGQIKTPPDGESSERGQRAFGVHGAGTCHGHRRLSIGSERLRIVNEDASGGFYERA